MVQIIAYTQVGGDATYLDLGAISIKATYSSKEIQDITSQKSNYTHNITLPYSKTNNDFFAHYYEVNVDGAFRADVKASCSIYVDSNLQFEGYLQLLKVDNLKQNYTVICYGDIANLATELGESKLNDLDLSKYNHLLSASNVAASWVGLIPYIGSQPDGVEILYPIIDYSQGYNGNTLNTNAGAIKPRNLKPSIQIKALLDEIVSGAGYTINSTFLNSTFFTSQYMTLGGEVEGAVTDNTDGFKVGMNADQTVTEGGTIAFNNETGASGYYDVNGNFNTTSNAYTVPIGGVYGLQVQLVVDTTVADTSAVFGLFYINGAVVLDPVMVSFGSNTVGVDVFTGEVGVLILAVGDVVTFKITAFGSSFGSKTIKPSATVNSVLFDSFVKLVSVPNAVEGGTVDLDSGNQLLSKDKQVDFVKAIFSRYNLISESDKTITNQLNIEPIQDYRDAGTSKDWTDKLDVSKSILIEPTSKYRKAEINLTDKEDKDIDNVGWLDVKGSIYNSHNFPFYGDFGTGSLEVPTIFSSFVPDKVPNSKMFITKHYKDNDGVLEAVTTKPKLFYYSGLKNLPPSSYFKLMNEPANTYTTVEGYPFCHHYSMAANMVVSTDTDIRFKSGSVKSQSDIVETQTTNDVYTDYWSKSLNNIYNKDARVMSAYFYLNSQDIADFKYNDKVFVKDSYWLINKIDSYAMGVGNSTKVELLKIIETPDDSVCALTMVSSNVDGSTNWEDADGVATDVTALCCEANGMTYVGGAGVKTPKCYW